MSDLKHGALFTVIARGADNVATRWQAQCGHHATFVAESYEAVEDEWRKHVHAETGSAPKPCGDKTNRWEPTS